MGAPVALMLYVHVSLVGCILVSVYLCLCVNVFVCETDSQSGWRTG